MTDDRETIALPGGYRFEKDEIGNFWLYFPSGGYKTGFWRADQAKAFAEAMNAAALAPVSPPRAGDAPFQARVDEWVTACFGETIRGDKVERNHRFLEEALELVQSAGCSQSEAHQLVDYVFARPIGDLPQEVGGVMNTLAALCNIQGVDMAAAGDTELARCWTKIEKIRAKQAAKPKHSPLPEYLPPRAGDDGLAELSRKATPGELAIMPQKHDDWGYLRSTTKDAEGFMPIVAIAHVEHDRDERESARREGRQPKKCEANSAFIVALWNAYRSGQLVPARQDGAAGQGVSGPGAVPAGWRLVPVEPTEAMLEAAEETAISSYTGTPVVTPGGAWAAMLAAAPTPAATPSGEAVSAGWVAEAAFCAQSIRDTVGWLASHAKGMSLIDWNYHSNILLDVAIDLDMLAATPTPAATPSGGPTRDRLAQIIGSFPLTTNDNEECPWMQTVKEAFEGGSEKQSEAVYQLVDDVLAEFSVASADDLPAATSAILSWNGFIVHGDVKSISEVQRGINAIGRDEQQTVLIRHQRSEIGKLHARQEQAARVMPLIGPLIDAWEGLSRDGKSNVWGLAPALSRYLDELKAEANRS